MGRFRKTAIDYHKLANERKDIAAWLGPEVSYVSEKTWWLCAKCGNKWEARYNTIQQGHKCLYCNKGQKPRKTKIDYIKLAEKRGFVFIGPMVKNTKIKTNWKCTCGNIWLCNYRYISIGHSCPQCNWSSGENFVAQVLKELNVEFHTQYKFSKCRSPKNRPLFFDFAIIVNNKICVIEYDGKQHYSPIELYGGKKQFEKTSKYDQIKNQFVKNHNIPLLRIPYYKHFKIRKIVTDWIHSLH